MSGVSPGYFVLNAVIGQSSAARPRLGRSHRSRDAAGAVGGAVVAILLERVAYRSAAPPQGPPPRLPHLGDRRLVLPVQPRRQGVRPHWFRSPLPFTNGTGLHIFGAQVQTYYVVIAIAAMIMLSCSTGSSRRRLGRGIPPSPRTPRRRASWASTSTASSPRPSSSGASSAAPPASCSGSSSASSTRWASPRPSKPSPPRCSAGSATSAARCSVACSSAWSRTSVSLRPDRVA